MPKPALPTVTLFTRPDCHLCHAARYVIERVARDIPLNVEQINIDAPGQELWQVQYSEHIPVVHINDREFARHRVIESDLRRALRNIV